MLGSEGLGTNLPIQSNHTRKNTNCCYTPSFVTLKTGGSVVISCGNNDRTLSTSNRNKQSLSSDRAGDAGVDNGVLGASVGGSTGICRGGRTGGEEDGLVAISTPKDECQSLDNRILVLL